MSKFIYRMENILSIKYKLEDQAKTAFGQAQMVVNQEEEKLVHLQKKQKQYEQALRGEVGLILNIREIIRLEDAIEITKYKIKIQVIAVNQARQQLELKRIELNHAMVERKTQEKLKENAFEVFKKEVGAQEQKEIDELVSFVYGKA